MRVLSVVKAYGNASPSALAIIGVFWVYGLENFLDDVELMLEKRPTVYWRICWGLMTPLLLAAILIYTIARLTPLTYSGVMYPSSAYAAGWSLFAFGVLQIPFWMIYTILTKKDLGVPEMFLEAFRPSSEWGPKNARHLAAWRQFKEKTKKKREQRSSSRIKKFVYVMFGCEGKLLC